MTADGMTFDFNGPAVRTVHASGVKPNVHAHRRAAAMAASGAACPARPSGAWG